MPIFEYTLKAASLKDPTSAVPIYERVAKSDQETTRFMRYRPGRRVFHGIPIIDMSTYDPPQRAALLRTVF